MGQRTKQMKDFMKMPEFFDKFQCFQEIITLYVLPDMTKHEIHTVVDVL